MLNPSPYFMAGLRVGHPSRRCTMDGRVKPGHDLGGNQVRGEAAAAIEEHGFCDITNSAGTSCF